MYLTLLDLIRHWFFCVSLLCMDKKENRPEIHWVRCSWNFFGVHFLTPRCFCLFSPDKVILYTKIFRDAAFPKLSFWEHEEPLVLSSNIVWQLCFHFSGNFAWLPNSPSIPILLALVSSDYECFIVSGTFLQTTAVRPADCTSVPCAWRVLVTVVRHGPCMAHSIGRCCPVGCSPISC